MRALLTVLLALTTITLAAQGAAPVWAKSDAFWYRRTINGANVWIAVDAEHGVRQPLFDHQRLAIELSQKMGTEFTAQTLPFADPGAQFSVKYDGSNVPIPHGLLAIEFVWDAARWRCELQAEWNWGRTPPSDYECSKQDGPATAALASTTPPPVASPDGKWEAFVTGGNVVVRPAGSAATPIALSTDGTADRPYAAGSIAWSADSKTVTAYRLDPAIWQSDAVGGNVKALIGKGSWPVSGR